MRDRAQVVRGDRDAHRRARLEQAPRERLEVRVAVGLALEDRHAPAVLARLDDLVVPVGALDEPHDERLLARRRAAPSRARGRASRASRAGRPAGRSRRSGRRANSGSASSSRTSSSTASRESSDSMSMCRCAPRRCGAAQQLAQARRGVAHAALGRLGAQQRRQRRDLDREVRARQRADARRARARGCGFERRVGGRERVERRGAARGVAVGLGGGDRRLAEQVDGGRRCRRATGRAASAARPSGSAPTMKRWAMCRTPAAPAAPSAARPAFVLPIFIAALQRRRLVVDLVEEAGRGASRGRRASGTRGRRRRSERARRAARRPARRGPSRARRAP